MWKENKKETIWMNEWIIPKVWGFWNKTEFYKLILMWWGVCARKKEEKNEINCMATCVVEIIIHNKTNKFLFYWFLLCSFIADVVSGWKNELMNVFVFIL